MTIDEQVRSVLQRESDRCAVPPPDIEALMAGGRDRRRRLVAVRGLAAAALIVVALTALAAGLGLGDQGASRPAGRPSPLPSLELPRGAPTTMPYCVPDPRDPTGPELIVGAGPTIKTWCRYHDFPHSGHHAYFWHHAGRTILASPKGVSLVADGQLTKLGISGSSVRISDDGRYAALVTELPDTPGTLLVYDLVEGRRVVPAANSPDLGATGSWIGAVEAIDELSRVYVWGGQPAEPKRWMYDIRADKWTKIRNLPESVATGFPAWPSYPTDDGFAVLVRQFSASEPVARSVEGRVTADGRFVAVREVPLGLASRSPDGSRFLQLTAEGFWVQPADDFSAKVVLQLPFGDPPDWRRVAWDAQWESGTQVYLSVLVGPEDPSAGVDPDTAILVRCFVDTGHCERLDGFTVPLSNIANPGG